MSEKNFTTKTHEVPKSLGKLFDFGVNLINQWTDANSHLLKALLLYTRLHDTFFMENLVTQSAPNLPSAQTKEVASYDSSGSISSLPVLRSESTLRVERETTTSMTAFDKLKLSTEALQEITSLTESATDNKLNKLLGLLMNLPFKPNFINLFKMYGFHQVNNVSYSPATAEECKKMVEDVFELKFEDLLAIVYRDPKPMLGYLKENGDVITWTLVTSTLQKDPQKALEANEMLLKIKLDTSAVTDLIDYQVATSNI